MNVTGSSREDVLRSIQAALEAAGSGLSLGGGRRENPWAWVLAVAATEALVELARELHTVIFDGLWPRFLTSDEFNVMMNTEVCVLRVFFRAWWVVVGWRARFTTSKCCCVCVMIPNTSVPVYTEDTAATAASDPGDRRQYSDYLLKRDIQLHAELEGTCAWRF